MKIPLLIDLDGVLKINNKPAKHINKFLRFIKEKQINSCIISNSTIITGSEVGEFFKGFGIEINCPILTAADAAYYYVKNKYKSVKVYGSENAVRLFEGQISDNPEAIIIGDLENKWSYDTLNEIFNYVISGRELIAMQKNKFWKKDGKLLLDAGAFINAIEYATDTKAELIGKPSPIYFNMALNRINCNNGNGFFMLGDDLETDIKGAQKLGGIGILILTGKTSEEKISQSTIKPDYIVKGLDEVQDVIN